MSDDFTLKENCYLVFTGDYVDRGEHGAEVWYTLMRLKLANWDRVFLIRGNHEEAKIVERYGFLYELKEKYRESSLSESSLYDNFVSLFDRLPLAVILGNVDSGHIMCSHGAWRDGFKVDENLFSKALIIGIEQWEASQTEPFSWTDFNTTDEELNTFDQRTGRWNFNFKHASEWLKQNKLLAIFRGHQHLTFGFKLLQKTSKEPQGWKEIIKQFDFGKEIAMVSAEYYPIFTLSTAAEGVGLPYDCFVKVKVGSEKTNWSVNVYEVPLDKAIFKETTYDVVRDHPLIVPEDKDEQRNLDGKEQGKELKQAVGSAVKAGGDEDKKEIPADNFLIQELTALRDNIKYSTVEIDNYLFGIKGWDRFDYVKEIGEGINKHDSKDLAVSYLVFEVLASVLFNIGSKYFEQKPEIKSIEAAKKILGEARVSLLEKIINAAYDVVPEVALDTASVRQKDKKNVPENLRYFMKKSATGDSDWPRLPLDKILGEIVAEL